MIPVEGHKLLYRDKKSRNIRLSQKEEIDGMKKDIEEIKNLLRMIAEK